MNGLHHADAMNFVPPVAEHGRSESLYPSHGRVAACCDRARRRVRHLMESRVPLRSQRLCVIELPNVENFLLGSSFHRHAPRRRGYIARPPASRETRFCAIGVNGRDKRVPPASRETGICVIGVNGRDKRVPPASRETRICAIGVNGLDKRVPPVSCPH